MPRCNLVGLYLSINALQLLPEVVLPTSLPSCSGLNSPPRLAANLEAEHPNQILIHPVACVSAQHVEILNFQRTAAGSKDIVYLTVVVQEESFLLGYLLPREVVNLLAPAARASVW